MSTAAELPGLLRGCVKWRDGRAWVDNDALLIVADWCEDNDRPEEADEIRSVMEEDAADYIFVPADASLGEMNAPGCTRFEYETMSQRGRWENQSRPYGACLACCAGGTVEYEVLADEYETLPDRVTPQGRVSRGQIGPTRAGLDRVRDLARWHCIAHMLGYPPMRLLGEEGGEK
jgi:hypothetical protein